MGSSEYHGMHFERNDFVSIYSKYRPMWPQSLYDTIVEYCRAHDNKFETALDLGCGSGQGTFPLTKHFKNVFGRDRSAAQVGLAPENGGHVEFSVGPAEDLAFLDAGTVDLVTIASAVHWMDHPKLYKELNRVMRPGAVFAPYSYHILDMTLNNAEADSFVKEYFEKTKPYSPKEYLSDFDYYRDVRSPFASDFQRIEDLSMEKEMPLSAFKGYIETLAMEVNYQKETGSSDALDKLHAQLVALYKSDDAVIKVTFPVFVLMAAMK